MVGKVVSWSTCVRLHMSPAPMFAIETPQMHLVLAAFLAVLALLPFSSSPCAASRLSDPTTRTPLGTLRQILLGDVPLHMSGLTFTQLPVPNLPRALVIPS